MRIIINKICLLLFFSWGLITHSSGEETTGCPDITWQSLEITSVVGTTINYNYTLKNIGSDTVFVNKVVIQNYTAIDSSLASVSAAGGSYIYPFTSELYILPGNELSLSFSANSQQSAATNPFLVAHVYLVSNDECNTTDNYCFRRIPVISSVGCVDSKRPEIFWLSATQSLSFDKTLDGLNFNVINLMGNIVYTGKANSALPNTISLSPGIYLIEIVKGNQKFVERILVE